MDTTLTLWLLGAAAATLLALLFIVLIARGMASGKPAIKTNIPAPLAKALGVSQTASTQEIADKTKEQTKGVVAIFTSLAVIAGVIGVVKGITDGDIEPVVSEITAGELRGTMVNARNSNPVVLIVPGSGPTDRDGNSAGGLSTNAYKLLAEGLIEERISSVRVDKRGLYGSAGAGDPNNVTPATYAADYGAWIDAIKAERGPGSGCVFLLGHSEGALMVSLAAEGRKDVCGLILVAGIGRPMGEVMRRQIRDNPANAPLVDDAMRALDALEAGQHVDVSTMHPALQQLFAPAVQDYLISVVNIDPVEAVRRAGVPTLIVQGKTDLQVTVEDAKLLDRAPKTKMTLIDGMNHVLKKAPMDRAENLATYADPTLPLARKLVSRIEDFIDDND
jgi:uncharacterized protein